MRDLVVPRSVWPAKCHRVTAWHKDEHITKLLRAEDQLSAAHGLRRQQERLPADTIRQLVGEAVDSSSVYRATAAMDLLYDAHESYSDVLEELALAARKRGPKAHQRIACCIGFLRLGENRREIIGKSHEQIMSDWAHFKALATTAQGLVRSLEAG
jgi:hypothetical protein